MFERVWLVLGLISLLGAVASAAEAPKADSYIKVEIKGKLQTGIVAIGGETTGVVIQAKDGSLELNLGTNKDLRAEAEKLNGKAVVVTGTLTVRRGVEVRQRLIVTVATIKSAEGGDK